MKIKAKVPFYSIQKHAFSSPVFAPQISFDARYYFQKRMLAPSFAGFGLQNAASSPHAFPGT
jgi:hypothetical protein